MAWTARQDCNRTARGEKVDSEQENNRYVVKDPRAARPYLFSDGQNMYNRVVLVCTVSVYIRASLGRRPILRYQVLQVRKKVYSL